ncbi:MAG: ribosome maturation factor RimP [Deltaproteobacteria bacterium]|nr:ribosome maturation factor RimP [Deltaproteobacteria bacterium]
MKPAGLEDRIKTIAEPILASLELELVHVEYITEHGSRILRVYIDKPGGVTLDDCADVSRALGAALDVEDPIHERYALEVSSPGLDRPLVKEADYVRFAGKKARIRTKEAVDGRRNFKAVIGGAVSGVISVTDFDGRGFDIAFTNIEKARLEVEI